MVGKEWSVSVWNDVWPEFFARVSDRRVARWDVWRPLSRTWGTVWRGLCIDWSCRWSGSLTPPFLQPLGTGIPPPTAVHKSQYPKRSKAENRKCRRHSATISTPWIPLLITLPLPMTDLISWPGYPHWIRSYGIRVSGTAELKMWENGS